jgi:DNA-binding transcriptional LysR family regulator
MDRFHLMQTFVAVVDEQGFAGAARKLGISPPAVTRAIAELERRVGARLLTRTTRVVRVTDAGARYADDCRRILAEADEADASAGGVHRAPRGRLTVTAPAMFGGMHVTPIAIEYLRRHPEVSIGCWFVDRIVNLVEEGADVAIRIGELPDSSLTAIRVGAVRRVICAAPAYLGKHGTPCAPSDLARHTIVANRLSPHTEWRLAERGAGRSVRLAPRLMTTTNEAAIEGALAGFGIARVLSYQVADHVRRGRLKIVLEDCEPPPWPVHVMHREGRHASRKIRAFVDLAVERLRANPVIR